MKERLKDILTPVALILAFLAFVWFLKAITANRPTKYERILMERDREKIIEATISD